MASSSSSETPLTVVGVDLAPDFAAELAVDFAVELSTVVDELSATLKDLREQQSRAVHAAAERALGWPTVDDDLQGYVAASRDRDRMRGKYLVTLHLAHVGEVPVEGLVANARRYGATWADVGAVLDLTRQVAHGRFRHLDDAARHLAQVLPDVELDPSVPLDGGDDLTTVERAAGGRAVGGRRLGSVGEEKAPLNP